MLAILALHTAAAQRGDGLHPKLMEALGGRKANPGDDLVTLSFAEMPPLLALWSDQERSASHVAKPAAVVTLPSTTAS